VVTEKIKYYVVKKGFGYWVTTPKMRALGFSSVACGHDGLAARSTAQTWNARWQTSRRTGSKSAALRESRQNGYVYFLRIGDRIKIGWSARPFVRAAGIKTDLSSPLDALAAFRGTKLDERRLHRQFAAFRTSGEWFACNAKLSRFLARAMAIGKIDDENEEASESWNNPSDQQQVPTVAERAH
jgi:hypothetical protein